MVEALKCGNRQFGSLAQLVERHVYTVDVIGSIPVGPTTKPRFFWPEQPVETGFFVVRYVSGAAIGSSNLFVGAGP